MAKDFNKILDECIDRVNRGENVDTCLAAYPEHAEKLRPLLETLTQTQTAFTLKMTNAFNKILDE
jgi:hypothetical protein